MTMPTRIIKPPELIGPDDQRAGLATHRLLITCDDGQEYTSDELAKLIGFRNAHGLLQRLHANGWECEHILTAPVRRGVRISGNPVNQKFPSKSSGNWHNLGGRARTENLDKIRRQGTWEAQQ